MVRTVIVRGVGDVGSAIARLIGQFGDADDRGLSRAEHYRDDLVAEWRQHDPKHLRDDDQGHDQRRA